MAILLSPGIPGGQHQQQPGDQLLVGGTTVALQANRGGRRRESRAWMTKAHVEGHVDTASIGGEVEKGIPASRPNVQELCQGSLDEVEVVHLKRVEQGVKSECHLHRQE